MWIVITVFLAFLIPVLILLLKERPFRDRRAERLKKRRGSVNASVSGALWAGAALFVVSLPALYLSDASYSFHSADEAVLKVAFKLSGKRVAECNEAGLVKAEGERYRAELRDSRQVAMDMQKLADCPRERHPVFVEVRVDGKTVISRPYTPAGLKKDMASYIYAELGLAPGAHRVEASVYTGGAISGEPDSRIDAIAQAAPRAILLIRFDHKDNTLVLE